MIMTQQNINKSIILLGPSCVGKTLISETLSTKLNLPVISIDDLLMLVGEEMDGCLNTTPKQQRWFINDLTRQILMAPEYKETLINPKYVETQKKLMQQLVDFYNFYHEILGDLKPFYPIIEQNRQTISSANTDDYLITSLNDVSTKIINLILQKVDQPIIIDSPGSYGWQFLSHLETDTKTKLMLSLKLRPTQAQKEMNNIISSLQSVLLMPGEDYNKRNSAVDVSSNNLILKHLDDYIDADIMISCNGLFFSTDSPYFKQRKWLDAREILVKEQLKNKAEISNICDQIIYGLQDLNQNNENTK